MSTKSFYLAPEKFSDYCLLDSGNFEKLEKFGTWVLRRPEPQAVWSPSLSQQKWDELSHAQFVQEGSASGKWLKSVPEMPDQWHIQYLLPDGQALKFRLALTGFKHVGIFPEQASNWDYIFERSSGIGNAQILNLFAYTGGASLAARAAEADVIHCDAIRQVVSWAKKNMELSRLDGIRWLVEDAMKFVKREAKRGKLYNGIILDPPAWGHGPKGEKWKLEAQIDRLIKHISQILAPKRSFLVFNAYALGFSPLLLESLLLTHFPKKGIREMEIGELYLADQSKRRLPAGVFARFHR